MGGSSLKKNVPPFLSAAPSSVSAADEPFCFVGKEVSARRAFPGLTRDILAGWSARMVLYT